MNRLQKKCFIAAAGFHLLLFVILLVGPAFFAPREKADDLTILNYVPANLIDAKMNNNGGKPNVTPPPAPPTPTPPQPEPQEQKTLLQKILEPATPKPPEVVPNLEKTTVKVSNDTPIKTTKPSMDVDLTPVKRTAKAGKTTSEKNSSTAQLTPSISGSSIASRLRGRLSGSTEVSIPGPGGAAYANYADAVASIYYQAWILPDEAADDASVKVKITIARDGSVIAARIMQPSGSAALNRSVQQTLNRVQNVGPFPEGAKDAERAFFFEFQPKFRKQIG